MTERNAEGLRGPRCVIKKGDVAFPPLLERVAQPPKELFVVGCPDALLGPALAVVGARKATPYGKGCARRFARLASLRGICIVSGGARGCDAEAHRAALEAGGRTVAFLGGGCDRIYPPENLALFQRIVDEGGAVVSEREWGFPPVPYAFRARNRLIAGISQATLIVEAGLPSGTFSTADEALAVGAEVLAVPGSITSASSRGANRLIAQGATPIVDDDSFLDALFGVYGCLRQETVHVGGAPKEGGRGDMRQEDAAPAGAGGAVRAQAVGVGSQGLAGGIEPDPFLAALSAEPIGVERLRSLAETLAPAGEDAWTWLSVRIAELEATGLVKRYPDGKLGPAVDPLV